MSRLWHLLRHDRCISFWADDILWHYHQKSNNKISILELLPLAKSNHLPLNGNRVWSKQSVTACPLIQTPTLLTNCKDFYLIWAMFVRVECKWSLRSLGESIDTSQQIKVTAQVWQNIISHSSIFLSAHFYVQAFQ